MSKEVKQFPFYINYMDVDSYLFWLMDEYGEDAAWIDLIDQHHDDDSKWDNQDYNADDLLLIIRQFLVDNGFEEEVDECDRAFAEERKGRGKKNPYIPMHKRWEMDDADFKEMEKKKL